MDRRSITTVRAKGQLTIPAEMRESAHIEEGTVVEMALTDDGVIEVRAKALVNAEDAWFWSPGWQAGEREATAELEAGEGVVHDSDEALLAVLDD
jgi:AbrB family looped-hinge helix DNA binding protein